MREWLARLRDWFRRDRLDRELQDELRFHRQQLTRDARAEGAAEDAAVWAARRRLGNETRVREDARERWSIPWLDHLQQDVRYALRGLRRSPGFTITVILTLGLGIGANAAMFGVIDRLMFRPFPYLEAPGRVHRVYLQSTDRGEVRTRGGMEYTRYLDLRRWTTSFDRYAGYSQGITAVGSAEASRERRVARVSAEFFDFFDASPVRGRFFVASEDTTPEGARVAVLGYAFWQTEFGGRDDALGQVIQIGNVPSTIIGVAPKGFIGVSESEAPAAYVPITTYAANANFQRDRANYYTRYNWGWMNTMVRRRPGVSVEAASRDLSEAHRRSWVAELAFDPEGTPAELAQPRAIAGALKSAAGPSAGLESKTLLWVTGVAVIVLLIACANVANLMLARVLRRRREVAVRLALGVSRGRLMAQALTESLLLAILGCVAGVAIAHWGGAVLRRLYLRGVSSLEALADGRTLGVALGAAVAAALLTGLAPAVIGTRTGLAESLKSGAREGTHQRSRTRAALLVLQGALSVILLVGAGLFVRSLDRVRDMRMGYDVDPVLIVSRILRGVALDDSAQVLLGRRLLEAGQTIPGAERAAWVSSVPFWSTSGTDLFVGGIDSVERLGQFTYQTATPDYFATMGTRIVRGRPFTADDRANTPKVLVVSEAMARVLWPGREALGQCVRVGTDTVPCSTVIGIAEDAVQNSLLDDDARLRYYMPLEQYYPANARWLLLRVRGDPASQVEPIRRALQAVMPGDSYVSVRLMSELVGDQRRSWMVGATMFGAFGLLALVVAGVGLYGVIAYNVTQRTHELGVRAALGARTGDIVRLVMGQGVRVALAGVVIGTAVALWVSRWVQPLLFQQSAKDPLIYGLVGVVLVLVALAASASPALRAAKADPNAALRSE